MNGPSPEIITGDLSLLYDRIEDGSVDLIFTDPPYFAESVPLYGRLAQLALAKLKPGGLLLTYAGSMFVDDVIEQFRPYRPFLSYHWTFHVVHRGSWARHFGRRVRQGAKIVLVYAKSPVPTVARHGMCRDTVISECRSKENHPWEQGIEPVLEWVEFLSPRGGLVVDPFVGGGTTAVAALRLKRRFIGTEIDPATAEIARKRVEFEAGTPSLEEVW